MPGTVLPPYRILDLSSGMAGPYAAKLLADLGADVIKVEPPAGDAARAWGPYPDERRDPDASAPFLFANTGKRGITLDLDRSDDHRSFMGLVAGSDVVIAGEPEPTLADRGLGLTHLQTANPAIILVTVTGFGSDGPYRDWAWSHLVGCAMGGWAHLCGDKDREPLQIGGRLTETLVGAYGAVGTLIALAGRERHGHGDHVDVSGFESAVTAANLAAQRYEYVGEIMDRLAEVGPSPSFILECGDGYLGANALTDAQWRLMCTFFGQTDLPEDPQLADPVARMALGRELIEPAFLAAVQNRTPDEVFHDAQEWRIPFGLVPSVAEAFDLPPHQERAFFAEFDHPSAGHVRVPGVPFLLDGERPALTRPPLLGEHNAELVEKTASSGRDRQAQRGPHKRALEGVRIVDLSMFMSGPFATLCFADAGAEVIKVESLQRIDGWRGAAAGGEGAFWEESSAFNWINRNKTGITLNLTDERGVALLKELIRGADAVVENYSPRVMGNFGLDYAALREVNSDVVLLSMPGFGLTGPWRNYVAFASTTEQMAAIPHLTGYAGEQPIFSGTTGGDPLAGLMGATALLVGIERRRRGMGGCHIDLSQAEAATSYMGDVFTAYSISGEDPGRRGNFNPLMAPHGTYRCRNDHWLAIGCRSDAEFRTLASAMGHAEWRNANSGFATLEERQAAATKLDAAIGEWTHDRDAFELMRQLQTAGVAAGAVMTGRDLLADPHLAARGFFLRQDREVVGSKRYPGSPFRFALAPPSPSRPAPTLGEYNREILCGLLGLSNDQFAALEADRIVGTAPVAAMPE